MSFLDFNHNAGALIRRLNEIANLKYQVSPLARLIHRPLTQFTNPARRARTAAWVRSSAQSLFKILRTWVLTVPTVM